VASHEVTFYFKDSIDLRSLFSHINNTDAALSPSRLSKTTTINFAPAVNKVGNTLPSELLMPLITIVEPYKERMHSHSSWANGCEAFTYFRFLLASLIRNYF
jgi:hypothetical protein